MVTYEVTEVDGRPRLVRSNTVVGEVNEGEAKVANIQMALGRRPVFAADTRLVSEPQQTRDPKSVSFVFRCGEAGRATRPDRAQRGR